MKRSTAASLIASSNAPVLKRERVALAEICRKVIAETSRAHPDAEVVFNDWDEAFGAWDRRQLAQLVRDLFSSALARGGPGGSILLSVSESGENALLLVVSSCQPGNCPSEVSALLRARNIVQAHGGRSLLIVRSNDRVCHISLPRFAT